ncbi:MAG: diaminopimelate dehydrogenase [Methanomassiliicoccaceae archaeon]|nr:diaminopimelate dehydrogenase [Methanomassiliicoccaceae archaeon]
MSAKIRAGIYGYGNIGKSVEKAIMRSNDITAEAVFTRRDPGKIRTLSGTKVIGADKVSEFKDKIDVMLLCGGSATDLPVQGPELVKEFNIVDSYDTHAKIPDYMKKIDSEARQNKKAAIISAGWDPGLFSIMRSLFMSVLPEGENNTFWGPGVSQGHSDALRRVEGVSDAIQYTVPSEKIFNDVKNRSQATFTMKQKLKRICYVVAEKNADKEKIKKTVKQMPNYFADYETDVIFISSEEMKKEHSMMNHAGNMFRNGSTDKNEEHQMEFRIKIDSNPGFTASIMVAYARAAFRLFNEKNYGAKTVLDVPVSYLSAMEREQQIKELL